MNLLNIQKWLLQPDVLQVEGYEKPTITLYLNYRAKRLDARVQYDNQAYHICYWLDSYWRINFSLEDRSENHCQVHDEVRDKVLDTLPGPKSIKGLRCAPHTAIVNC